MWRTLIVSLASLIVAAVLWTPPAFAQRRNEPDEGKETPPPALQYTVAALSTILIMVILCMPSRKRTVS